MSWQKSKSKTYNKLPEVSKKEKDVLGHYFYASLSHTGFFLFFQQMYYFYQS